ncbi:MAG: hypothetical protein KAG14_00955, partial [Mycoplasmataceae bacterium]|nr:hypothetical protein [Mycoplasmataceae bacterium]
MIKFALNSFKSEYDLNSLGKPIKVEFIQLLSKKIIVNLTKNNSKNIIQPFDVVWIRMWDKDSFAHDIIAKDAMYILNKKGLIIQFNSEFKVIDPMNLAKEIRDTSLLKSNNLEFKKDSIITDYIKFLKSEIIKKQVEQAKRIKQIPSNKDILLAQRQKRTKVKIKWDTLTLKIMAQLMKENHKALEEMIEEKRL